MAGGVGTRTPLECRRSTFATQTLESSRLARGTCGAMKAGMNDTKKLTLPDVAVVAESLRELDAEFGTDAEPLEVRLHVLPTGSWSVCWGASDYDTDHRGFWGAASIELESKFKQVAQDLVDQVAEQAVLEDFKVVSEVTE